jgi:hypothetical protein
MRDVMQDPVPSSQFLLISYQIDLIYRYTPYIICSMQWHQRQQVCQCQYASPAPAPAARCIGIGIGIAVSVAPAAPRSYLYLVSPLPTPQLLTPSPASSAPGAPRAAMHMRHHGSRAAPIELRGTVLLLAVGCWRGAPTCRVPWAVDIMCYDACGVLGGALGTCACDAI